MTTPIKLPPGAQARIARTLGLNRDSIRRYCAGIRRMPPDVRAAIDAELDMSAPLSRESYLIGSSPESAEASHQRRAEYRREMGAVHDHLNSIGDDDAKSARFVTALAEDERRYVQRRAARQSAIELARDRLQLRSIEELAHKVFGGKLARKGYSAKRASSKSTKRLVTLVLSDHHTGARLDERELPRGWGWVAAARRTAYVCQQAADYKPQYRDVSTLRVAILGDLLEGMLLHDIRGGEPLTEQWLAALRHLGQGIAYLASAYPRVEIVYAVGNHGRDKVRHEGRALVDKWDAIEMRLYLALRESLRHLPNVTHAIDMRPYALAPVFDRWAMYTHGDTNLGLPKSPKLHNVCNALERANARRHYWAIDKRGKRIYPQIELLCIGHVHYLASTTIALNPTTPGEIVINGALVPPSGHALDVGVGGSMCGQQLWESTAHWIKGDGRPLKISASVDHDRSLDSIITPYQGDLK
jgi:hypothetical protein